MIAEWLFGQLYDRKFMKKSNGKNLDLKPKSKLPDYSFKKISGDKDEKK